jgi:hypothetical protein
MPTNKIKELRKAGKLEEALYLAKSELESEPENLWAKRNLSWVYYEYLKKTCTLESFESFVSWINEIKKLELPNDEKFLFEQLCWLLGKMAFCLASEIHPNHFQAKSFFDLISTFNFPKPSIGYSFLFKGFHKLFKETDYYVQLVEWWGLENFLEEDYKEEKMPNGKAIMAFVEQVYINYAKQLLPKLTPEGLFFKKEKVELFLPELTKLIEDYPKFQYPAYFKAKLLLAIGDKNNMLEALLPFARAKRNDFWVWEVLAEAFSTDHELVFACYCKALTCHSPEEMVVKLRQKMARILLLRCNFNEAKTEVDLLVKTRLDKGFPIPFEVQIWQKQDWYNKAVGNDSNFIFYSKYVQKAESQLFNDIPEESVIVEFINKEKKILNFVASESKLGYFKYERYLSKVNIGDILKVRFKGGKNEGLFQIYTVREAEDESFKDHFLKDVSGTIRIPDNKPFGFLNDVFIHPNLVSKYKLQNGIEFNGLAIKSYNSEKKTWGWKLI